MNDEIGKRAILPINRLGVEFIEAPYEEVVAFQAATHRFFIADHLKRYNVSEHWGMLEGAKAGIEAPFGQSGYSENGDCIRSDERDYSYFGDVRVSRVRSNPKFAMVEGAGGLAYHEALDQASFGGYRTITVEDQAWFAPTADEDGSPIGTATRFQISDFRNNPQPSNVWQSPEFTRKIAVSKEKSRPAKFFQSGELQAFEDGSLYVRKKIADRMNIEIIFIYLDRIGIDPVATFERRELDDPVLFTAEPNSTRLPDVSDDFYHRVVRHRFEEEALRFYHPGEFYSEEN